MEHASGRYRLSFLGWVEDPEDFLGRAGGRFEHVLFNMELDVKSAHVKFTTSGLSADAVSACTATCGSAEPVVAPSSSDVEHQQDSREPPENTTKLKPGTIIVKDTVGVVCFTEGDVRYVYVPSLDYDAVVKNQNSAHLGTWWKFDA